MAWFWLALGAAVCLATADLLIKRYFSDLPLSDMVAARFVGLAPPCVLLLIFIPWPPLDGTFFLALGLALPAEIAAAFLYLKAIQVSPLGLTTPFLACSPLFVLGTGGLILGETPSPWGLVGVLLVVAGGYGLNLHAARLGWLEPLRMIGRETGSWMMVLTSLLYSYTAVMGKLAVLHSSPLFTGGFYTLVIVAALAAVGALTGKFTWGWLKRPWPALGVALSMGAMVVCHYLAVSMADVAYMIAVKRLSPMFAVLYGGLVLGEARLGQHLLATALMLAGAVLLTVWG